MMLIPGGNLLSLALRVVNPQGVQWERYAGRTRNALGNFVASYDAAATIQGSFQPMDAKAYITLGLDLSKKYVTFYTPQVIQCVNRGGSGDRVTYNGELYVAENERDWTGQDGWGAYTFVRVETP